VGRQARRGMRLAARGSPDQVMTRLGGAKFAWKNGVGFASFCWSDVGTCLLNAKLRKKGVCSLVGRCSLAWPTGVGLTADAVSSVNVSAPTTTEVRHCAIPPGPGATSWQRWRQARPAR
jgi:hypothetical protein